MRCEAKMGRLICSLGFAFEARVFFGKENAKKTALDCPDPNVSSCFRALGFDPVNLFRGIGRVPSWVGLIN
jgi:hypothetical protein